MPGLLQPCFSFRACINFNSDPKCAASSLQQLSKRIAGYHFLQPSDETRASCIELVTAFAAFFGFVHRLLSAGFSHPFTSLGQTSLEPGAPTPKAEAPPRSMKSCFGGGPGLLAPGGAPQGGDLPQGSRSE